MPANVVAKSDAWILFDHIVTRAHASDGATPWVAGADGSVAFVPNFDTLRDLLRVPQVLASKSTTGVPALAVDVWLASELRRAGFDRDSVWPRDEPPRVLPAAISRLLSGLGSKPEGKALRSLLATGRTLDGAVGANARVLGKNYYKQVDVGMSDWDTGPEVLISTKRMDRSFSRNAPNRVEESYGDAKNLRSRHPLAALGYVFALRSSALQTAPDVADWILDLLAKLGREDDAYDAVALILPDYGAFASAAVTDDDEDPVDPLVEVGLAPVADPDQSSEETLSELLARFDATPQVGLDLDSVPDELRPERFLGHIVRHTLDNAPVNRHREARQRLAEARPPRRRVSAGS